MARPPHLSLFDTPAGSRSWRGLLWVLGVYFGTLLLAALLAPPVYHLVQAWHACCPNDLNTYLARKNFADYYDRLRWLPLVLSLPWVLRHCGLLSFERLGLHLNAQTWKSFIRWFGIGALLILAIAAAQGALGHAQVQAHLTPQALALLTAKALLGGLLLGFLEETVFRGLLFRAFATASRNLTTAAVLASTFFAYVHFKHIPPNVEAAFREGIGWSDGFVAAWWTACGIVEKFEALRFANLLMLGLLLCTLLVRHRHLMGCVGLHAGAVFTMLLYKNTCTVPQPDPWLGGAQITNGTLTLLLQLLLLLALLRPRQKASP